MHQDADEQQGAQPPSEALTQYRLSMIERTLVSISESLSQLAQLEQKHLETREAVGRAFDKLDLHDSRIRDIELQVPILKLTSGWVLAGVVGIVALFGITLYKISTIAHTMT